MKMKSVVIFFVAIAYAFLHTGYVSVPARAQTPDPVIVAAGDIACGANSTSAACKELATSNLIGPLNPAAVLILGDNQYENGELQYFNGSSSYCGTTRCYGPTWGRYKSITRPSVGNHDYLTAGANGYFSYFGAAAGDPAKGYYSYNVGTWHMIAINSNCSKITAGTAGCGVGSSQYEWLRNDLATNSNACTLAYWHHPFLTSGSRAAEGNQMKPIFSLLYSYGADVVLTGHEHNYERFAPMRLDANNNPVSDPTYGIREFVVGTGGRNFTPLSSPRISGSEAGNATSFGILAMTLKPNGYDFKFLPAAGYTYTDIGSAVCHGPPGSTPIVSTPTRTPTPNRTPTPSRTPTPRPPSPTPTIGSGTEPTPTPVSGVPGDANGDGHVTGADYSIWLANYGRMGVTAGPSQGDFDRNGSVNGADYFVWLSNYGR
jgi:acid phosphatase type 7